MNLFYITNARIPTEKAHGIQIMKMCEAFANQGVDVTLIVPRRLNHIKEDPFDYYGVEKNFEIVKLPIIDLVTPGFGRLGYWFSYTIFSKIAFFYLLFKKADFYYGRHELPLLFLSLFKKNVYWEAHQPRWNIFTKLFLKFGDGVVVISAGLQNFFANKGYPENKIFVAYDAVDLSEFELHLSREELRENLNLPNGKEIISYVGRYQTDSKKKGVDEIIEAFSDIYPKRPNSILLIVGVNNKEKKLLEGKFKKLNIEEKYFSIVQHVPHKIALRYMQASDVLLMNYADTLHHQEYMSPLKLAEYMGSKTPIVTSDLSAVRRTLRNNCGYFFAPGNLRELKNGVLKILNDRSYAEVLSRNAYKDVQKYTWTRRAKDIIFFMNN